MKVIIVGNGKLSKSLLDNLHLNNEHEIIHWNIFNILSNEKVIILHAGSGRELFDCINYCRNTQSYLVDLSTNNKAYEEANFPIILCPNTALPIIKVMAIFQQYGKIFDNENIKILESHQDNKKTVAGTAVEFAKYFNQPSNKIESIREVGYQEKVLGIPNENLDLHAFHKITIEEDGCSVMLETKVLGHKAYISGVKRIVEFIVNNTFENRIYHINELIFMGLK